MFKKFSAFLVLAEVRGWRDEGAYFPLHLEHGPHGAGLSTAHRVLRHALAWRLELRRVGNSSQVDRTQSKALSQGED